MLVARERNPGVAMWCYYPMPTATDSGLGWPVGRILHHGVSAALAAIWWAVTPGWLQGCVPFGGSQVLLFGCQVHGAVSLLMTSPCHGSSCVERLPPGSPFVVLAFLWKTSLICPHIHSASCHNTAFPAHTENPYHCTVLLCGTDACHTSYRKSGRF